MFNPSAPSAIARNLTPGATVLVSVNLPTRAAGIFTGTTSLRRDHLGGHQERRRPADQIDLALRSQAVSLSGTVYKYAHPTLRLDGGIGHLTGSDDLWILDLGNIEEGAAAILASLSVVNDAAGPTDLLGGTWSFNPNTPFSLTGLNAFDGLSSMRTAGGFVFSLGGDRACEFHDFVTLHLFGHIASGYSAAMPDLRIEIEGSVDVLPGLGTLLLGVPGLAMPLATRRRLG